ncbi:hypothetical protein Pcinc_003026 [Petrolisthes cinctipes]|uniref:Myb/SANT-like DNA-binding domain-containing protein n=1 Tax=Petrolisthes cinctipes TaxID=88211 RepID=A0AAE1GJT3_PETCI|nr:hypothetical protein Pcinc_003026 [Petrolisthes cinctipes]
MMADEEEASSARLFYRCGKCNTLYNFMENAEKCCQVTTTPPSASGIVTITKTEILDNDCSPNYIPSRHDMWSQENTETLMKIIKNNYNCLKSKGEKRHEVWNHITEEMRKTMPGITRKQVASKWKNVKEKFRKYEEKKFKNQKVQRPDYFDIIGTFLEGRQQDQVVECGMEDVLKHDQHTPSQEQEPEKVYAKLLKQTIEENKKGKKTASKRQQDQTTLQNHLDEEEQQQEEGREADYPFTQSPPTKKSSRRIYSAEVEQTLVLFLKETKRHNTEVEFHNTQIRLLFEKIATSMEVKNKLLKEVIEKENVMET